MIETLSHPQRYMLSNELHARPFPKIDAPAAVAYIAFQSENGQAAEHDAFLNSLLDYYGAETLAGGSNHHQCTLGQVELKWERHTEFVTYTLFQNLVPNGADGDALFDHFRDEWLARSPGKILTSATVKIHPSSDSKSVAKQSLTELRETFVSESLAASYVLNHSAVIATDFRIAPSDHVRFMIFPIGQVGRNRLGRIAQRLLEIETYKQMAMFTLPIARQVFAELADLDQQVSAAVDGLVGEDATSENSLDALLRISAKIEELSSTHAYRFSAAEAYSALVKQRISVLREDVFEERQTFAEFMARRFDPAMRTCKAAQARLADISRRAARASDLLSTRVDVQQNRQNSEILARMDERAAVQLRLQETVEGLSVVAISYYGVNLLAAFVAPLAHRVMDWDKTIVTAALVLPVVGLVALMVRRIRRHSGH